MERQTASHYAGEMVMQGFANVERLLGPDHGKGQEDFGLRWTYAGREEEAWKTSDLPIVSREGWPLFQV